MKCAICKERIDDAWELTKHVFESHPEQIAIEFGED